MHADSDEGVREGNAIGLVLDETTEYSGELLRHIREARGVELHDIAERTKIHIGYLRAIEEENFAATPSPVYLRGFLKTVARDLKLDQEQVARTYMKRFELATDATASK